MTSSAAPQQSQSPSANALKEALQPTLRNAMSSLNINLDYELARYRYAKQKGVQPGVAPPQFKSRPRSLSLLNPPSPPAPKPRSVGESVAPPPPPPNPRIQRDSLSDEPLVQPSVKTTEAPASEVTALRGALVPHAVPQQETYLESSEALLEDFQSYPFSAPEATVQAPSKSWFENWNTPLGLGALLLLLVASAGFGFVLVNPSVAQNLVQNTPLARFLPASSDQEEEATENADGDAVVEDSFTEPPLTSLSPDLSKREFADLDLDSLSNLPAGSIAARNATSSEANAEKPPASDSSQTAQPNPAIAAGPQVVNEIPRTTTPAPQPAPIAPTYQQPNPAPATAPVAPPVPAATPAPTAPAVEAAATSSGPISSYYVVTDYTGDPSLSTAREVVDDAYVRNFNEGARIQLGAFNSQEGAAALAEELQNQGIEAQIYEP